MANLQIIPPASFRAYTIASSSEAIGYPAANVKSYGKWRRTWRSTAAVPDTQHVTADLGSNQTLFGIYLNGMNVGAARFQVSLDGITFPFSTDITVAQDARVRDRRHGWFAAGGSPVRFVRVVCNGTPDGGASFFEMGSLIVVTAAPTTMTRNVAEWRWKSLEASTETPLIGGGSEISSDGPAILEYTLDVLTAQQGVAMTEWLAAMGVGKGVDFLLFENRADLSHAYLVRRVNDFGMAEGFRVWEMPGLTFREDV